MSWRIVRLGDLVENFSVRAKDYGGSEGLDFCGVSNEEGIIKTKYAAEDKAEDYKIIEKGCFAYNPYRVNVGSIGLVTEDFKGLISPAYVVFKPKPNTIIPELLFKFLKSDEGLRQIRFYGRGTVRQALRFEDLCNIELSIPDYSQQEELFKKLINSQEKSNILSTELTHQLNLVKKLRQQLLQDAVQGKLTAEFRSSHPELVEGSHHASELLKKIKAEKQKLIAEGKLKKGKELPAIKTDEIPFDIPEGWVWCRLGKVCKVKVGSTPSRDNPNFWNGDIPWVSSGAVANNFIYDTKEKITKLGFDSTSLVIYPKGSILVAMIGQGKTRGQTSILKIDATTNQNVAGLIIEHAYLLSEFLWYFFLSRYEITRGGASGGNQPALNGIKISNTVFPFPPLSEQHRIIQKLDKLMQTCDALEASIKESAAQNEKLLQQVLREALRKA